MSSWSQISTVAKTITVVVLATTTCAIASTHATEFATSSTKVDLAENVKTISQVVYAANTSLDQSISVSTLSKAEVHSRAKSKEEIRHEIQALKELQECWDGEDAERIALGAIDSACQFLELYQGELAFDAFPDPDGSVGLQADIADGIVVLSFNDAGKVAYLIRKNQAIHRGHGAHLEAIKRILSSLF